ncbi:MAG: hypothetical protein IKP82_00060, partial [Oscillospiraceae bacterium]|nr:hypothetical protein [Oscillospiraceae bacterium]
MICLVLFVPPDGAGKKRGMLWESVAQFWGKYNMGSVSQKGRFFLTHDVIQGALSRSLPQRGIGVKLTITGDFKQSKQQKQAKSKDVFALKKHKTNE